MVFILDGCWFYYANIWSKSVISIWWRHLVTSEEWSNPIFFFGKYLFLHHACATRSEQPSNIKTMICTVCINIYHVCIFRCAGVLCTGCPRSYRKYIQQITQPSQYRCTQLQYRFAVISEAHCNIVLCQLVQYRVACLFQIRIAKSIQPSGFTVL